MNDKFISYTSLQLAGEEAFLLWVHTGEQDDLWNEWLSRHPEKVKDVNEARQIATTLSKSFSAPMSGEDKQALWTKIHNSILAERTPVLRPIYPIWKWGVAAAAALALLVWFNTLSAPEKVMAKAGEKKEFNLPEESNVVLNAGSTISYNEKTFDQNRSLFLKGEAFFTVNPGSTFTIETSQGTVTVLGTSFNVLAREGHFEVNCYSGKVKVSMGNQESITITKGERSIRDATGQHLVLSTFTSMSGTPEWIEGRFTFENKPLSFVLDELERQFNVKTETTADIRELKYTGLFELGDLDKALQLITWPLHLQFEKKGKTIIISH